MVSTKRKAQPKGKGDDSSSWVMFGFCRDGNSHLCPGVLRSVRDRLVFCSGRAHHGQVFNRCVICKGEDGNGGLTPIEPVRTVDGVHYTGLTCLDVEGCIERARDRSQESLERLSRRIGTSALRRLPDSSRATGDTTERAKKMRRRAPRPTPTGPTAGRCECCGEPTAGGRFRMGHDAKLKHLLRKDPSPEALAELVLRGWIKDTEEAAAATKQVEALVGLGQLFVQRRVELRLGIEPLPLDDKESSHG